MELKFNPFVFLAKIAEKYCRWFNERHFTGVLYEGTPKSKEEVKAWIMDCSQNSSLSAKTALLQIRPPPTILLLSFNLGNTCVNDFRSEVK